MPWLRIALGSAAVVVVGIAVMLVRYRRQREMRVRRSQNRRVEDAQMAQEWEDFQRRLRRLDPV